MTEDKSLKSVIRRPSSVFIVIDIRGLTFTYPGQTAPLFENFSWRVERGEFWSVVGASGCGKSTLLHLIVGVRAANAGTISVNGESVPRKQNRGKTGLVLQDYGLLPWATVRENVELGLRIREFYKQDGGPKTEDRNKVIRPRSSVLGRFLARSFWNHSTCKKISRANFRRTAPARRNCADARARAGRIADGRALLRA